MTIYNWHADPTKVGTPVNMDYVNEDLMYLKDVTDELVNTSLGGLLPKNNLADVTSQQVALDNLTDVANATDEQVLTKDTTSGNAIFKSVRDLSNVQNITWGSLNPQLTSYTLLSSDNGAVITILSSSPTTLSIPDNLTNGFSCLIIQKGTGQVSFVGTGSMTLLEPDSKYNTAKQYASVSLCIIDTNECILGGYTA
jgi:hypothetical protein